MARVLVTGGAGYIGSHVVRQLLDAGHGVVVFDNLSTGFADAVDPRARLVVADLGDGAALEAVFREAGFEAVLHFAARIVVPESVADPLGYYDNNTANTLRLVQAAVRHGVHRLVFSSTAAVYGNPELGVATEETPTHPISPYGRSKLMSEWILEDTAKATPLRYVALRYFNVAGASLDGTLGQRTVGATHLLKVACEAALGRRPSLSVFGTDWPTRDGTGERDYIHVEDLARAHLDALDWLARGGASQVLNCGYGRGVTVRELIAQVEAEVGHAIPLVEGPRRPGDAPRVVAAAERIREVLGWRPRYDDLSILCRTALEFERRLPGPAQP